MLIKKTWNPATDAAPAAEKGTNPFDNPGIKPHEKPVPETPGEKATNDPTKREVNKAQPFPKGSGYTKNS